jgi:hypothetical protein
MSFRECCGGSLEGSRGDRYLVSATRRTKITTSALHHYAGLNSSSAAPSAAVKAVGFDETYRTDDGVVVQVTEIDESKLGAFPTTDDPEAKEGDPFVLLTTKTTNSTKSTLQLVPTAVLRYGPEQTVAAGVLVDEMDSALDLEPDEAYDYTLGFIIPQASYDQVVMEMTVTLDPLRTVVFSGSITPS